MRASFLARVAAAAAGVTVGLAGLVFLTAPAGAAQVAGSVAVTREAAARPAASSYKAAGALAGVGAVSASNAWAVGYAGSGLDPKMLMVHWDGLAWTRVTSPKILDGTAGRLTAITVVSAKDAWAVGTAGGGFGHALILHWNGTAWSQVSSVAGIGGQLYGVTATASSGWAVGVNLTETSIAPLVLRWNGKGWSRTSTKLNTSTQGESVLNGVAVTGAKTAWAVGYSSQGLPTAVLARWNGSTWTTDTSFPFSSGGGRSLYGVATGPGGTAFAVGSGEAGSSTSGISVPLSVRWTGKAWVNATVSSPKNSQFSAVAFAPGGTGWATGDKAAGTAVSGLIWRWTGKTWASAAVPSGTGGLNGLGFATAANGWAVGTTGTDTVIIHWNGHTWS
jgi:hypothetical protein